MSNVIGSDSIVFNQGNLIPSANNNQYQVNFTGGKTFKNDKIAIKSISLPYSWKNISAAYGNNVFKIQWPNSQINSTTSSMFTYTVTIPDGFYTIPQLNTYIQQYCITNGLYLIASSGGATPTLGSNVYFISCQQNSTYYSVEFDFFPLPLSAAISSDGSGVGVSYKYPSNFPTTTTGYTSYFNPLLIVPTVPTGDTITFSSLIGYAAGTYPTANPYNATNVNIGVQSTVAPQVTPVQSIIIGCSLVSNKFGSNNAVIGTFGYQNTTYGQVILYQPGFSWYCNMLDGSFNNIIITFWDNNFNPLPIYDTTVTVELSVVTTK